MPAKPKNAANAVPTTPVLSLAEISGLSIPVTTRLFGERVRQARRSFVEQGKLVHHLDNTKLPKGQSIYGLLQSEAGVSEGSIHAARMVADLIAALVVPGHLPEARFDEVITFRISKHARALIQGKAAVKITAEQMALILATGENAAIGADLECLAEHGMTIADREAAETARVKAEATKAADDKAAAQAKAAADAQAATDAQAAAAKAIAEAETLRAQLAAMPAPAAAAAPPAAAQAAPPVTAQAAPPATAESDTSDMSDKSDLSDNPVPAEKEPEAPESTITPLVTNGSKAKTSGPVNKTAPPPPARPTAASIIDRINAALNDALDFSPAEIAGIVSYLTTATADLAATLEPLQVAAAA